jgi:hypothetical protein
MKYKHYMQEKDFWCVPACLQSVLELKRFYPPNQAEIAERLEIDKDGFHDVKKLEKFLSDYNLRVEHYNPFLELLDADFFLAHNLKDDRDVLAFYRNRKKHCSIVTGFDLRKSVVELQDPGQNKCVEISLPELIGKMQAREDERYGFYLIR